MRGGSKGKKEVALDFRLHPKQMLALYSPAQELLFGGATRGGKSYFVRVALITWCTWIEGLQCLILRKYYDDVIANHMEGPDGFRAMLQPFVDAGKVKITENKINFWNGSLITLNHCSTDEAAEKNQGIAKNVLVFEEACQILTKYIKFIRGWVTMSEEIKSRVPDELKEMGIKFPKIIYTGNPIGVSQGYFRKQFVKAAPPGEVFRAPLDDGGFLRQYIEARVEDNPSEDRNAVISRIHGMGDMNITDALLNANWDAPVGEFFPQYRDELHSVPNFKPPKHWFKFLTFDWGSSDPFAVIWWCVSDGTSFGGPLGEDLWYPRGSLIAYREWYGCNPKDPAKGCQMRNEEIAREIVERTNEKTSGLVITDSLPFQDRGLGRNGKKYTIADVFAENGCPLVRGNVARITGWTQVRDRLIGKDGWPLIYFQEQCRYTREYLPMLGRSKTNPEDAAESGEATHLADCVRMACTTRPLVKDKKGGSNGFIKQKPLTPKRLLEQIERQYRNNIYY